MQRINVDAAAPTVKRFLKTLTMARDGLEIELEGRIMCKKVPPMQLSDAEKAAQLTEVSTLLRKARTRAKNTPEEIIERDIQTALNTLRRQR